MIDAARPGVCCKAQPGPDMNSSSQLSAQISDALTRGDALGALRLMRQAGTHGLKDALQAAQAQATAQAQAAMEARSGQGGAGAQGDVRNALQSGDPIEAIRRLRAANPGMGLRDAKLAVDAMRRQAGDAVTHAASDALTLRARAERTPTVQEGDHGGYAVVFFAVAIALGALAWWWFGG